MVWLQGGVNALISSVPKRVNNMNHESTTKTRSGERKPKVTRPDDSKDYTYSKLMDILP
jgi:hypothetical protein